MIVTVQCMFCVLSDRELRVEPSVKRQQTANTKLFKFPFRPEAYKKHHKSQHLEEWLNYQLLNHKEKLAYLKDKELGGIHQFIENKKESLKFVIF